MKWISVKEKSPEVSVDSWHSDLVLIAYSNPKVGVGVGYYSVPLNGKDGKWFDIYVGDVTGDITYWMPLPELPEESD